MAKNMRQVYAINQQNRKTIIKHCPNINDDSGIYILTREEDGFKYAYIGQAVKLLSRLASHLNGYTQHIDLSIKKHKFYNEENLTGWKIEFFNCPESKLNDFEQKYILKYANLGYQLRNKTYGSQSIGKKGLDNQKQPKTYTQGKVYGYEKAMKEIAIYFEKYLDFVPKKQNKITEKKFNEFNSLINKYTNNKEQENE